jgi:hypothetical protein
MIIDQAMDIYTRKAQGRRVQISKKPFSLFFTSDSVIAIKKISNVLIHSKQPLPTYPTGDFE